MSNAGAGLAPILSAKSAAADADKALKAAVARGEIEYVFSENVANADYERVMREYATGGSQLILGEAFAVEAAARKVANTCKRALPPGLPGRGGSGLPRCEPVLN